MTADSLPLPGARPHLFVDDASFFGRGEEDPEIGAAILCKLRGHADTLAEPADFLRNDMTIREAGDAMAALMHTLGPREDVGFSDHIQPIRRVYLHRQTATTLREFDRPTDRPLVSASLEAYPLPPEGNRDRLIDFQAKWITSLLEEVLRANIDDTARTYLLNRIENTIAIERLAIGHGTDVVRVLLAYIAAQHSSAEPEISALAATESAKRETSRRQGVGGQIAGVLKRVMHAGG